MPQHKRESPIGLLRSDESTSSCSTDVAQKAHKSGFFWISSDNRNFVIADQIHLDIIQQYRKNPEYNDGIEDKSERKHPDVSR